MRDRTDRFHPRHGHTTLVSEVFGLAETRGRVVDTRGHLSALVQDELKYAKDHQPRESSEFARKFQEDLSDVLNLPEGYEVKFFTAGGTEASSREVVDGWVQVEDPSGMVMSTFKMNLEFDMERERRAAQGEIFYVNEADYKRGKSRFFLDKNSTYAHMLERASIHLTNELRRQGVDVKLAEPPKRKGTRRIITGSYPTISSHENRPSA